MKTLIFNGSPRKEGDTMALIEALTQDLEGTYEIVYAYDSKVQPCVDCRYCWENKGCVIDDEMQAIYKSIETCDNIVIASPIYFSEVTGPLLTVMSRLQTYFCARHFRQEKPIAKGKKGGIILVGGGDGVMDRAYTTSLGLLRHMNAKTVAPMIVSHNTNLVPASRDRKALESAKTLARFLSNREMDNQAF